MHTGLNCGVERFIPQYILCLVANIYPNSDLSTAIGVLGVKLRFAGLVRGLGEAEKQHETT